MIISKLMHKYALVRDKNRSVGQLVSFFSHHCKCLAPSFTTPEKDAGINVLGWVNIDLNGNMSLPGFHNIETVGAKFAELINDGKNHQGEFIELYPIVKED